MNDTEMHQILERSESVVQDISELYCNKDYDHAVFVLGLISYLAITNSDKPNPEKGMQNIIKLFIYLCRVANNPEGDLEP